MPTILTSDSDRNIHCTDTLSSTISSEALNDSSESWIQYLRDHRSIIRATSTYIDVSESTMIKYKYRIRKYLNSVNNSYVQLETAFRIVNRLYSDEDFTENLTGFYLPNLNRIMEMRKMYTTLKSKINKMN